MCRRCDLTLLKGRALALLAFLLLLGLISLLGGCGSAAHDMIAGGAGPGRPSFPLQLVIHNGDVAYDESMTVVWWEASGIIVGTETRRIPKDCDSAFSLWCPHQYHPTGFTIYSTAWGSPPGPGNAYGYPDYSGTDSFLVVFPSGYSKKQP